MLNGEVWRIQRRVNPIRNILQLCRHSYRTYAGYPTNDVAGQSFLSLSTAAYCTDRNCLHNFLIFFLFYLH